MEQFNTMKVKKYYFYITIILLSIIAITNAEAIQTSKHSTKKEV